MTVHNEAKKNEIAKTVIMPGDPLRAKMIAEQFLTDYKLVNQVRNMYAYTGYYKDKLVTVMASGMGIPSIGIYSYELYKFYDVENIIRVGSAGSIDSNLDLYDLFLVDDSYSLSSYAKILGNYNLDNIKPSEEINNKIENVAHKLGFKLKKGRVCSKDTFYDSIDPLYLNKEKYCKALEMESFGLFYNAYKLGKKAACILTISDNVITNEQTSSKERQNTFKDMIIIALEASLNL